MDVERFDPAADATAVRACHDIHLAAAQADDGRRPPLSAQAFGAWLRFDWTACRPARWPGYGARAESAGQARHAGPAGEREPQLASIVTHNADGNEHMIAINAELGYQVLELNFDWELEMASVPAAADLAARGSAARAG